jgi:hypothetical protein
MGHEVLALLFALLGPGDVGETVTLIGGNLKRYRFVRVAGTS